MTWTRSEWFFALVSAIAIAVIILVIGLSIKGAIGLVGAALRVL